jgi:hypothetical protein
MCHLWYYMQLLRKPVQSCCLKHVLGDAGFTCARTLVY